MTTKLYDYDFPYTPNQGKKQDGRKAPFVKEVRKILDGMMDALGR